MKIGFSFGRCVASIVRGEVDIADVLLLVARTRMPNEEDVKWVIDEYLNHPSYLAGLDRNKCLQVGLELFTSGRIIEPRANGINTMTVPRDYIWMDLYPTAVDGVKNEGVQDAWNAYRMLISLTEQLPEMEDIRTVYNPLSKTNVDDIDPAVLNALIV